MNQRVCTTSTWRCGSSIPYAGLIYRLFARLPYPWAYVGWLTFSLALYSAAVVLLLRSVELCEPQRRTGFLLAISSMLFLMESWIGGQISVVGFFAVTLFVFCRARNRRFFPGLALALAVFKPTLIAIPVLMLFCGRRWRMLGGVITGAAALALASIRMVEIKGCAAWLDTLKFYGRLATGPAAALRRKRGCGFVFSFAAGECFDARTSSGGCGGLGGARDPGDGVVAVKFMERGLAGLVMGCYPGRRSGFECVHADLRHHPGRARSSASSGSDAKVRRERTGGFWRMAGSAVRRPLADAIVC
jgi:hypothetical protein